MAGLGNIVQKAFYLGVGLAASAGEQAGEKLSDLKVQANKLVDEMVAKGEITTEEGRRMVDEMVKTAQQQNLNQSTTNHTERAKKNQQPRRIEIVADGEEPSSTSTPTDDVSEMRKQVAALQEELQRMKQK